MSYEKIELIQTCGACPEQYDAYFEGNEVGYLRLRHGYFRAEYLGEVVYDANTIGDGIFDCDEREGHLDNTKRAIYEAMTKS